MIADKPPKPFCSICAGNTKLSRGKEHTLDPISCRPGRELWYRSLSNEEQMEQLRTYEILSTKLATYIWELSVARNKSPLDIMNDEGLRLV